MCCCIYILTKLQCNNGVLDPSTYFSQTFRNSRSACFSRRETDVHKWNMFHFFKPSHLVFVNPEDYEQLVEDIVRDGRLYASENHQEILKVCTFIISSKCVLFFSYKRLV